MTQHDLKIFYNSLIIGDKVEVFKVIGKTDSGVLMDKYITDLNVFGDVLLDNGQVLEHIPFFDGIHQRIMVIDKV